jgi:nitrite reductase/ring-hydroxylating ferredoxin subunit
MATRLEEEELDKKYVVARVRDVPEGTRLIVTIRGRSIGVFNVEGRFYALLNRCPHLGGELCKGDVIGLVESDRPGDFRLDASRHFIACPWHAWEYDLETGQSWFNPGRTRARPFAVTAESGTEIARELESGAARTPARPDAKLVDAAQHRVKGPYTASVFPVEVDDDYIVISLRNVPRSPA